MVGEVVGSAVGGVKVGDRVGSELVGELVGEVVGSALVGDTVGDIVGLVQDFEKVVDEKQAEEDAKKILSGDFTMVTFLDQIRTLKKMGSVKDIFEKMPFFGDGMPAELNDNAIDRVEAIILSMTKQERREPDLLTTQPSRMRRISRGSGTETKEVKDLISRFHGMRNVMKQAGGQPGMLGQLPGFKQMNMLKKMRGAQMGDFFEGMDDMGLGDLMGGSGGATRRGPTQAELQARVAAKQKLRKKSKAAAKTRKKNKRK